MVEILLAKARPAQLLAGKVIGIGVLGLIQLVGFVVLGLVTASVTGSVELQADIVPVAAQVVAWFVLGFALYSCLLRWAAPSPAGPRSSRAPPPR